MNKYQQGGTLLEALVSLAIFAIGILGLLSSLSVSTQLSGENRYRTEAVATADELFGQMAVLDARDLKDNYSITSKNFQSWLTMRIQTLPSGDATINFFDTAMADSIFVQLTISWRAPHSKADAPRSEYTTTTYFRYTS